jgi:hypothetical protein
MSIATLVMGESGTGKSTSMRNLDPAQTLLIQSVKKPLPFKSADWKPVTADGGNVIVTDNSAKIVHIMCKTVKPIIIVDDFQYIMANEFMRRVKDHEVGNQAFAKYNEIARNVWDIFMQAQALPDDKRVYILSHTETNDAGKTKIKTIGKLLDDKIVLEGLVTIVLRTLRINDQYVFATQNSGSDTTKSPLGMFESEHVENDLAAVDKAICQYYGITTQTKD